MRLDENKLSYYNTLDFDDDYFDAQLEEIETLYLEIDLLNKTNNYKNFSKYNQQEIEKVNELIIFYTMFNVYVVIAVCRTIIMQNIYESCNIILFTIVSNQNNPRLHVS